MCRSHRFQYYAELGILQARVFFNEARVWQALRALPAPISCDRSTVGSALETVRVVHTPLGRACPLPWHRRHHLGVNQLPVAAGGKRAAWLRETSSWTRAAAVRTHAIRTVTSPVSHLVAYLCQLRRTVCHRFDHLEGDAMAWWWSDNDAALARRVRQAHLTRR